MALPARRPLRSYYRARGATLLELLVVCSIIATLVALVAGAALSARGRANILKCSTHLLQLGVATKLYIADWGTIPLVWYGGDGTTYLGNRRFQARPPTPPFGHDMLMVLGDYVSDLALFQCPVARYNRIGEPIFYHFNEGASGYRLSQIWCGPEKALLMACPLDCYCGWLWHSHGGRANALFADGHVKAYKWINYYDIAYVRNPVPVDWRASEPTTW